MDSLRWSLKKARALLRDTKNGKPSTFADAPTVEFVKKYRDFYTGAEITELVKFASKRTRNTDALNNESFEYMGLPQNADREYLWPQVDPRSIGGKNPWMQHKDLDRRMFQDMCVQNGSRNHFLFLKGPINIIKKQRLREEYLMSKLGIKQDMAARLSKILDLDHQTMEGLGLSRESIDRLLYGYVKSDGRRTTGMAACDVLKINELIEKLEEIVQSLPKLPDESFLTEPYDEKKVLGLRQPFSGYVTRDTNSKDEEWDKDAMGNNNPYSAHPLHSDTEDLDWEIVAEIKSADLIQLTEIQGRMFEQKNYYTGYKMKAKYSWMNDIEIYRFWEYVKARRQQILDSENIHQETKVVEILIKKIGKGNKAKALIFCYRDNNEFELDDQNFKWTHRPSDVEIYYLWGVYNNLPDSNQGG